MIDPLTIEEFLEHGRTWLQYGPDIVFSFNQQDLKMLIDTYKDQQREIELLKTKEEVYLKEIFKLKKQLEVKDEN